MNPVRLVLLAAVAVALTACGTALAPAPNLSGVWSGSITNPETLASVPLLLTLEDASGFLSGTALIGGFVLAEVTGVRDSSHATMVLSGGPLEPGTTVAGTFTRARFTGSYEVPGGLVSSVVLNRQ